MVVRDDQGRLLKGHGLKSPGRPPGLAAMIREKTSQGADIVAFLVSMYTGHEKGTGRDRLDAAKVLLERGWGKAPEIQVHLTGEPGQLDPGAVADEILERMARDLVDKAGVPRLATGQATVTLSNAPSAHNPSPIPAQPTDTGTVGRGASVDGQTVQPDGAVRGLGGVGPGQGEGGQGAG